MCEYLSLHLDVLLLRPHFRFRLVSNMGVDDRSCRYCCGKAGCEIDLEIASHVSFY